MKSMTNELKILHIGIVWYTCIYFLGRKIIKTINILIIER